MWNQRLVLQRNTRRSWLTWLHRQVYHVLLIKHRTQRSIIISLVKAASKVDLAVITLCIMYLTSVCIDQECCFSAIPLKLHLAVTLEVRCLGHSYHTLAVTALDQASPSGICCGRCHEELLIAAETIVPCQRLMRVMPCSWQFNCMMFSGLFHGNIWTHNWPCW